VTSSSAFFSYSRVDSDFALRLAQDLKAAGALVWLDQVDIAAGSRWDNAIEDALTAASYMLVILSPTSVKSENVRDEIDFAFRSDKDIIPILYIECSVPLRLGRKQRIDFRSDYALGLAKLLGRLGINQPPQAALDKATEMDAQRDAAWRTHEAEAQKYREQQQQEKEQQQREALRAAEDAQRRQAEEALKRQSAEEARGRAEEEDRKQRIEEAQRPPALQNPAAPSRNSIQDSVKPPIQGAPLTTGERSNSKTSPPDAMGGLPPLEFARKLLLQGMDKKAVSAQVASAGKIPIGNAELYTEKAWLALPPSQQQSPAHGPAKISEKEKLANEALQLLGNLAKIVVGLALLGFVGYLLYSKFSGSLKGVSDLTFFWLLIASTSGAWRLLKSAFKN
jgi:hypothetical protein